MRVLIVGLLQFDSGKTSVAVSLVGEAVQRGVDVGVLKPVTAFSGWYHYPSLERSRRFGKLIGEDVYKLHRVARSSDPIEFESPVVLMHMPPDPERVEWQSSYFTALNMGEQVVALRITKPDCTKHLYVPSNVERLTEIMRREAMSLIESLNPRPEESEDVEEFILNVGRFADECVEYICSRHELTVIESFNNASAPSEKSKDVDVVLLTAPTKVAIYEGKRYCKAVDLLLKPPWLITSEEVVSLLKPVKTIEIPPKAKREGVWVEGLLDEVLNSP